MKVWTCVSPSDIIIWCIDPLLVRDVIRRQIRRPLIPGIASPYIILLFLIVLWYHSSYTSNIAYSNENCMDNCLASCYETLFNKTKLHAISAEKNIYNLKPLILQLFLMSHAWQIWEYSIYTFLLYTQIKCANAICVYTATGVKHWGRSNVASVL